MKSASYEFFIMQRSSASCCFPAATELSSQHPPRRAAPRDMPVLQLLQPMWQSIPCTADEVGGSPVTLCTSPRDALLPGTGILCLVLVWLQTL
jgi:hypothetical protein